MKTQKTLALCLALLLLCGCGKTAPAKEQPTVVDTPTQSEVQTEAVSAADEHAMDPIVLWEEEPYRMAVVDFHQTADWGALLTVELRNDSGSAGDFALQKPALGGVMCDPLWQETVPAGETIRSEIWWTPSLLADCGVGGLRSLTADLVLPDGSTTRISAELPGEGEERIDRPESDYQPVLLAEGDDFKVTAVDFDKENRELVLHLVNETNADLMFAAEDVTVAGTDWDPGWAMIVLPECEAFARVRWDGEGKFGAAEFLLRVYAEGDDHAEDLFADTVTVQ